MNDTKSALKVVEWIARFALLLLFATVVTVGCKKQQQAPAGSTMHIIDSSRFFQAFSSSPPETRSTVDSVMMSIQGSDTVKARSELDRLAKMPGITAAQQAAIKDLSDQLDKKIAVDANAAAPK